MNNIDFTVIIPHRNSVHLLPRLFSSIPDSDKIEVILVDNSPIPITLQQIRNTGVKRNFILLFSSPERGAGGARNVGLENAHGKWLVFADADDYFAENAFEYFYRHINSSAEIVYFCAEGIYPETGERSDRGDSYTEVVNNFLSDRKTEMTLRLGYSVPWGKMIRRDLINRHMIKFDEVIASNDSYFSLLSGYYATKIDADDSIVYFVTVTKGSLTRRRDINVILSRYQVTLRYNKFVKEHKLSRSQKSVMVYFYQAKSFGLTTLFKMLRLAIRYKQNIFIGYQAWFRSYLRLKKLDTKESRYIVNDNSNK